MTKAIAMLGLVLGMGLVSAQAPPGPVDGLVFTTDDTGKSYPYLFALNPPPWAIKEEGAVDKVKYPNGTITSKDLKVKVISQKSIDGVPEFTVDTTADVSADKLTFKIKSPVGGIPGSPVTVIVTGKFTPSANDPERDVNLSAIAGPK